MCGAGGDAAFQFEILLQMGLDAKDMEPFKDPEYWVKYFPPTYGVDLARFGMSHAGCTVMQMHQLCCESLEEWFR